MMKSVGGSIGLGLVFPFFLMSGEALAEGNSEAGAKFFKSLKCAACHGKDGKGQVPAAKAMKIKTTDWTDKAAMEKLKDDFQKNDNRQGWKGGQEV